MDITRIINPYEDPDLERSMKMLNNRIFSTGDKYFLTMMCQIHNKEIHDAVIMGETIVLAHMNAPEPKGYKKKEKNTK